MLALSPFDAWPNCEASEDRSDLETTIFNLISGQYDNPVRVIAFNAAERWSEDISEDTAGKRETLH